MLWVAKAAFDIFAFVIVVTIMIAATICIEKINKK